MLPRQLNKMQQLSTWLELSHKVKKKKKKSDHEEKTIKKGKKKEKITKSRTKPHILSNVLATRLFTIYL